MASPTMIYQLKVTLRRSRPPIWRRIHVPSNLTLARLHDVLQGAMGWMGGHLHQFVVGERFYGTPDPDFGMDIESAQRVRLADVLSEPGEKIVYEYDFGDDWVHDVRLERVLRAAPGTRYPVVVAGKRACPPEDCGGIYGYTDFLAAIRDPEHPEHEELLEWCGGGFDPEAFDLELANARLRRP
ncbi:MAG: plasmid pRiA4b ORF-3 family protein [Planctomycetes bacterium]|nr:plasmid pRiA4b ORF-3 family protein [Planctomycetota bacterium]